MGQLLTQAPQLALRALSLMTRSKNEQEPRGKEGKIKDLTFWPNGNRGS
jgi:hypothetical protein